MSTSNTRFLGESRRKAKKKKKKKKKTFLCIKKRAVKLFNLYHSLRKFSRRQINDIFSYFSQKRGFGFSCKLSRLFAITSREFSHNFWTPTCRPSRPSPSPPSPPPPPPHTHTLPSTSTTSTHRIQQFCYSGEIKGGWKTWSKRLKKKKKKKNEVFLFMFMCKTTDVTDPLKTSLYLKIIKDLFISILLLNL